MPGDRCRLKCLLVASTNQQALARRIERLLHLHMEPRAEDSLGVAIRNGKKEKPTGTKYPSDLRH